MAALEDDGLDACLLREVGVGRYVSLEQIIANTADGYYETLLSSTHGWHEQAHHPWPWLTYFVSTLTTAYDTFEGLHHRTDRPAPSKIESGTTSLTTHTTSSRSGTFAWLYPASVTRPFGSRWSP